MKKILMAFAASMVFSYARAQPEAATTNQKPSEPVALPADNSPDNIANKSILHRNTLDAGIGKPDNIKRKLNEPSTPLQPNIPRVKVDTTTTKSALKPSR